MIEISPKVDGNHVLIDVRDIIRKGMHPRGEILKIVREMQKGCIIEIHVPHRTQPLIKAMEDMGLNVSVTEVEPGDFRLLTVKL
jgi:uncharacterized protein (DUF2249 family)